MKKILKKIWAWAKLLFWLSALIVYVIVYAGPRAISIFWPKGRIFGRK